MITTLTKIQQDKMVEYRDRWIDLGLNPKQFSEQEALKIITGFYTHILKKKTPPIVICPSPYWSWYGVCVYNRLTKSNSAVGSAVYSAVGSAVYSAVDILFVWPWLDGHYMVRYFAWYDFMFNVLGVKNPVPEKYAALKEIHKMDLIYPFDDICIVSQNPTSIRKKGNVLHHDTLPAVDYGGYENYYFLNGVRVVKEIVATPWNKLDTKLILSEKNAEVRREIVRKIGIEKVCSDLGAVVSDKSGDYELLMLDIGDNRKRPYLKMLNPSIGTFHIEGVHPDCDTVEKAINWRNGTSETPVVLT